MFISRDHVIISRSPIGSRPPTPKSDTEFEKRRSYTRSDTSCQTAWTGDDMQNCDELQWEWGELPTNINTPQQPRVQQQDSGKSERSTFKMASFLKEPFL